MSDDRHSIKEKLRNEAFKLGFDTFGITDATDDVNREARLRAFLEEKFHGEMSWLAERIEQRSNPKSLWPEVKSVIALGMNYGPDHNPLDALNHTTSAAISVYAQNNDYHDIIKKKLKSLARSLLTFSDGEVKVFVDTAPVMEKPLAQNAGLGWQGKHTNLVSRDFGSWTFLGIIYTTIDLPADEPAIDSCGSCKSCITVCPTDAFVKPYQLDARKCISYLTIEHKGAIPIEFRKPIGNRIYGCDDCLAVCPWNKFASQTQQSAFHTRDVLKAPLLSTLCQLDDATFRTAFSKSPIKRIGRDRFVRNVLIAIGNSDDATLVPYAKGLLHDDSAVVRGAAVWALSQLLQTNEFCALQQRYGEQETDPSVKTEWLAAHLA